MSIGKNGFYVNVSSVRTMNAFVLVFKTAERSLLLSPN